MAKSTMGNLNFCGGGYCSISCVGLVRAMKAQDLVNFEQFCTCRACRD